MVQLYLKFYAMLILTTYLLVMISMLKEERYIEITSAGLNVIVWSPFLAYSLGWF